MHALLLLSAAAHVAAASSQGAPDSVLQPRNESAGSMVDTHRVVFMHIQATGGTAFLEWMLRLHAVCARNFSVADATKMDGGYRFLNADAPAGTDFDDCGPARKVCSMEFRREWQKGESCVGRIQRLVDDGCTFVELHHYDVSVVEAFRSHGFKAMTVLRNPVERRASELSKWETGASGEHLVKMREIATHHSPDNAIRFLSACWADDWEGSCVRDMENASRNSTAQLGQTLRRKLEEEEPAAYCTHRVGTHVPRKVTHRLYDIASKAMENFDLVGTTELMQSLCKNFAARFDVKVPLLPSEDHQSHRIHSPWCIENGGDVNCTNLKPPTLYVSAAIEELGPDLKLWHAASKMQRHQSDLLQSGPHFQSLLAKWRRERRLPPEST